MYRPQPRERAVQRQPAQFSLSWAGAGESTVRAWTDAGVGTDAELLRFGLYWGSLEFYAAVGRRLAEGGR